jgi:hypothetical protein
MLSVASRWHWAQFAIGWFVRPSGSDYGGSLLPLGACTPTGREWPLGWPKSQISHFTPEQHLAKDLT